MNNENRKGFLRITNEFYTGQYEFVKQIYKDIRPTHIEFKYWEGDIWYIYAVSDLFDETKEGERVPEYECIFTKSDDNTFTHQFKKVF